MSENQAPKSVVATHMSRIAMSRLQEARAALEDLPISKLPVDLFKQHFLPLFSGQGQLTPDQIKETMSYWYQIVGHQYGELDLVEEGQVVLRVPSAFDRSVLGATAESDHETISQIFILAQKKAAVNPNMGMQLIGAAAQMRETEMTRRHHDPQWLERWQEVFKYFGLLPKEASVNAPSDNTPDFEF